MKSGRRLCTFFMKATDDDLGVFGSETEPVDEEGRTLETAIIFGSDLGDVRIPMLVERLETHPDETARLLVAHGGGRGDVAAVKNALTSGAWPESGEAAEEAAAFAHQLLKWAKKAVADGLGMGVCWEYRGEVTS